MEDNLCLRWSRTFRIKLEAWFYRHRLHAFPIETTNLSRMLGIFMGFRMADGMGFQLELC